MKTKALLTTLVIGAICQFAPQVSRAQDVDSMAPVVVKTVPEAGIKNVAPGEMEIRVTFSKDMMDGSWSWSSVWKDSTPEGVGKPRYEADHKTCVFKVKLEPNKTYGYWINSQNFHGFKDTQGHAAVPYLLVFQTKPN
jgi:Bacterial Ig-like domain